MTRQRSTARYRLAPSQRRLQLSAMKMIRQSTISGMMQARGTQMPGREVFGGMA